MNKVPGKEKTDTTAKVEGSVLKWKRNITLTVRRNTENLQYLPTKFILGVDVFLAAIFAGTADTLVLAVLLRDEFPVVVRPFTEEVAIEVFTVQLLAAMLEGEAVGFEADTAVEEVAWLTTFGSVEGMGLPSFVCNLTTYKIKAHLFVRKLRECKIFFTSLSGRHYKMKILTIFFFAVFFVIHF